VIANPPPLCGSLHQIPLPSASPFIKGKIGGKMAKSPFLDKGRDGDGFGEI